MSVTVRAMGPAVSWSMVMGMMPWRLMRPIVGRNPTIMAALDGPRTEPLVSVPMLAAQNPAATPPPAADPGPADLPEVAATASATP